MDCGEDLYLGRGARSTAGRLGVRVCYALRPCCSSLKEMHASEQVLDRLVRGPADGDRGRVDEHPSLFAEGHSDRESVSQRARERIGKACRPRGEQGKARLDDARW